MELNYDQIAELLDNAAKTASPVQQISTFRQLNIEEAYAIQSISLSRRYLRDEKLTGLKLGFTSVAKMQQMGVHDMIWGRLTDAMEIKRNDSVDFENYIHPRVEPEIAFRLSRDIGELQDLESIKSYIYGVTTAIEVIDSRFENFKFSLEDVIADNCSSTGYCLGSWQDPNSPISNIPISLSIDNEVIQAGNTEAILGNPWESMLAAVRLALQYGIELKAGQIVLAGAATAAVYVKPGQEVKVDAEGFDSVSFNIKK